MIANRAKHHTCSCHVETNQLICSAMTRTILHSENISLKRVNQFNATGLFLQLLKTPENQRLFLCFQGVQKQASGMKWVKQT